MCRSHDLADRAGQLRMTNRRWVLGIDVDEALRERWRSWWAPARQPFPTGDLPPRLSAQIPQHTVEATAEWRDTFFLYGGSWTWLTEGEFEDLSSAARRALRDRRRAHLRPKPSPAWPSRLSRDGDELLLRWVEAGVSPSEHALVDEGTWARARQVLPGAEVLAGTFAAGGSGANCFATVIAAADGPTAHDGPSRADEWVQVGTIERWLERRTTPWSGTARDDEPGTVLVWTEHGRIAHAAITLGNGWVLHKPSQSWSSPRLVWSVRRLVHSWTFPGTRLSRRLLVQ